MLATDASDGALLEATLREAGHIARAGFEGAPRVWEKSRGNPVTETDLAVDVFLREHLCAARPDYGWLSEESDDTSDRLARARLFIADPIDGTIGFIKRKPEFTICAAVIAGRAPVAAAIYNPVTGEMFTAVQGGGAWLNGTRIGVSPRTELEGCRMLVARDVITHPAWPTPWPPMEIGKRASIAYRMALVACGSYDGMMALSSKHEWDTAAGALIVAEAGGCTTTHRGLPLLFNQEKPVHPSLLCAGPALHAAMLARTAGIPLP